MADINIAKQIIDAVGGADNVIMLNHCMTRLRFALKSESKAKDDAAKKIEVVKGLSKSAGQYQLILGSGTVDDYYDLIMSEYSFSAEDYSGVKDENQETRKGNPVVRAVGNAMGILSGSIAPWLGCIMGSLMISAILSLFTSLRLLNSESSTYLFFSTVSGVCVYMLPVLIGFSAAEKLETNKYMGALLGAIMIYPNLITAVSEGTVSIFGLAIRNFSYTSTIVPVILAVWLLKYVEKFARKICPKVIYVFGVTLIELVITVPLIFLVVGPIGAAITNAISSFVLFIYYHAGFLAPAAAGAIMPLAVMCGVHLGLFPIAALMITDIGFDPIIHPALMVYNMSIAGSSLAYGIRSKNAQNRALGISSGISGVLGISEAGLFSIVLPNKRILITTEIGILISGIVTGIVGYNCYVPLSQSVFSVPAAAHGDFNLAACAISLAAGIVASFIVTYLFGVDKKLTQGNEEANGETAPLAPVMADNNEIVAVADGELIDVAAVSDPVFSNKTLGESVAFKLYGDKAVLCSPANGTLTALFPTGHAYGVTMENGVQLMVHCGVNTVETKGDGFRILGKEQGDPVKAGEPIVEVDMKRLSKNYDMSAILIILGDNTEGLEFIAPQQVKRGMSVIKE